MIKMRGKLIITYIVLVVTINKSSAAECAVEVGENTCDVMLLCDGEEDHPPGPDCLLCDCGDDSNATIVFNNLNELKAIYNGIGVNIIRTVIARNHNFNVKLRDGTFENFELCEHIDISNNDIDEADNFAFRYLFNLRSLNLSRNSFEIIQAEMFCLSHYLQSDNTEIQILDLSYNKIKSLDGTPFLYTPSLTHLYLQNNELSQISNDAFYNLNELTNLYLNRNKLTKLNNALSRLSNLMYLNLSHNLLTDLTENDLDTLTNLRSLDVSNNAIITIPSCLFTIFSNLEFFDFNYNINSKISDELFKLDKSHTVHPIFSQVISKFEKTNIVGTEVGKNYITEITNSSFVELHCMDELNLSSYNIEVIRNYSFASTRGINRLNISKNIISKIETAAFFNVTQISILDLSYNKIANVSFLNNCLENLDELYVNNNKIRHITGITFATQTKLTKLDISMNMIVNIEKNSLPLHSLQYLYVYGNNLTGVIPEDVFSPAKYLKQLDLSGLKFTEISKNALIDLPNISKLDLSDNNFTKIQLNNFKNATNLQVLNVSFNKLQEINVDNEYMIDLKQLIAHHNNLTNISNFLKNLSNVPNLQELYLSNNHITSFEMCKKNVSQSLLVLDVSSNPMHDINISNFEGLLVANLSNIGLSNVNNHRFPDCLNKLHLDSNNITDVTPGSLDNLKQLKSLNISKNFIQSLHFGSFKGLISLEILDLSYNLLEVLDVHVFHECDNLQYLYLDFNKIMFIDIHNLVSFVPGIRVLSIGDNAIMCTDILHRPELSVVMSSIHKVFDDDNINGIRCRSWKTKTQDSKELPKETTNQETNSLVTQNIKTGILYSWLIVLSLIIVVLIFNTIYRNRLNTRNTYRVGNNVSLVSIPYNQGLPD